MGCKYIDCRDYPGDVKCTLALSANSEDELLDAAMLSKSTTMRILLRQERNFVRG